MMMRGVGALVVLAACGTPAPQADGTPDGLAAYLQSLAAGDAETRSAAIAGWRLDRAGWERTVTPLFRPLYDDYVTAFAMESPALRARLTGQISARKHFAGDPRLTGAEARARWSLPVLSPSLVADAGDQAIDAVFVVDHGQWRALIGIDRALRGRVARHDPVCAEVLALAGPPGRCSDAGAAVAGAALRTEGAQELGHACRLAEAACGKALP